MVKDRLHGQLAALEPLFLPPAEDANGCAGSVSAGWQAGMLAARTLGVLPGQGRCVDPVIKLPRAARQRPQVTRGISRGYPVPGYPR
jgi:hypothetical protein